MNARPNSRFKAAPAVFGGLLLLICQNLAIFWRHYFHGFVFPDDFLLTYHAVPAYWIEALGHGKDVAWIPVQAIGYPIYMALQSGYAYLPLRVFAWMGQPYTLHAAVVLQGMHVLLGGVGAVICSRLVGTRWRSAVLAGVLYQCFGGFYSNAQHPDIVRSFSFLPWLCGPVLADWKVRGKLLTICTALLPAWIYAQFTGGYPGAAIASTLLLGGLTVARLAFEPATRPTGALVLLAQISGPLLAGWALAPAALDASLIDRAAEATRLQYDYLQLRDVLALSFPVDTGFFAHDLSMRSMFIAIPGLVLAAAAVSRIRGLPRWPQWCLLAATLAAAGPLHRLLKAVVPPAGLSRFVMADYRGFIGLGLILLGVQWLERPSEGGRSWRAWPLCAAGALVIGAHILRLPRPYAPEDQIAQIVLLVLALVSCFPALEVRLRGVPVSAATAIGLFAVFEYHTYLGFVVPSASSALPFVYAGATAIALLWLFARTRKLLTPSTLVALVLVTMVLAYQATVARPDRNGQIVSLCAICGAALLALASAPGARLTLPTIAVLALLSLADWTRVTWDQRYFAPPVQDGKPWLESSVGALDAARAELDRRLAVPSCRPARVDPPADAGPAVWAGYYTGVPHLQDHGIKLTPQQSILRDPMLREFARQPWRMVSLDHPQRASLPKALAEARPAAGASCIQADTTTATYLLDLPSPQRLVENEVFWKGWSATLKCLGRCDVGGTVKIQPTSTLGFRTWTVPAGRWQMQLHFSAPHRAAAWLTTFAGLVGWILLCALLRRSGTASVLAACRSPQ